MRKQAQQNKIAWEYKAYETRIRQKPILETAKEILDNPMRFLRYHQSYFENISGKRIANVCGSDGRRTIPFAVLGAEATIFDISESQKKYALELAKAVGVKLEYVLGDFCETNVAKYGNKFDFLYLEGGIAHYFSEIDNFTKMLYAITKPSGRLILCDFHPYRKLDNSFATKGDYFDSRLYEGSPPLSVFSPQEEQGAFPKVIVRYYTMSEIINSIISSGFTLKELIEHPHWKDNKYPVEYTIIADKTSAN